MGNADTRWKLLVGEVFVSQPSAAGHTGTGGHHVGVARELNTVSKFGHGVLATSVCRSSWVPTVCKGRGLGLGEYCWGGVVLPRARKERKKDGRTALKERKGR